MSAYETRKDGSLDVKGYRELFETETRTTETRKGGPVVKKCPECGQEYDAEELKMLLDFTGSDEKCEHDECNGAVLVEPDADEDEGEGK